MLGCPGYFWGSLYGVCYYPSTLEVMAEAVIHEVDTYISQCQNTVEQFILTRRIMDLCLEISRSPGARVS